ncbi:MAG: hypothetical protein NXI13_13885 [Proteobacteria bacterium]|nr:hypothetical protein [Pseudomonadota bacterium]
MRSKRLKKLHTPVDKSVLTFGTEGRLRDRDYLDSYEGRSCMVCGSTNGVVGAHVNYQNFARGLKAGDNRTAALCDKCHRSHDGHGDIADWWMKNYVFPRLEANYEEWKNDQTE